jgi:hypothetical protein
MDGSTEAPNGHHKEAGTPDLAAWLPADLSPAPRQLSPMIAVR